MIENYGYKVRAYELAATWRDAQQANTYHGGVEAQEEARLYAERLRKNFNPRRLLVSTETKLRDLTGKAAIEVLRRPVIEAATAFVAKGSGHALRRSRHALSVFGESATQEYANLRDTTKIWGQAAITRISLITLGRRIIREERRAVQEITQATTRPRTSR